ncbi:hypothetical protein [Yersinia ruckeri]|uniref:hypothetical protein n=1 Tax=Yersinia ruckeri TaxID=29486 RepID=UPI00223712E6|nr:hypothetical protein [Yersinia ruckeri]MCW6598876.1 hypothetical protein [Yersinia ruckeri]
MADNTQIDQAIPDFKYKVSDAYATEKLFSAFGEEALRLKMLAGIVQNRDTLLTEQDVADFRANMDAFIGSVMVLRDEVTAHVISTPATEADLEEYRTLQTSFQR